MERQHKGSSRQGRRKRKRIPPLVEEITLRVELTPFEINSLCRWLAILAIGTTALDQDPDFKSALKKLKDVMQDDTEEDDRTGT